MTKLIIDCDPGADDALALLLAFHSAGVQVEAITTVCGNGPVAVTAANAVKICRLAGHTAIPVIPGAAQPMKRSLTFSTKYCGSDGLCDTGLLSCPEGISSGYAPDELIRRLTDREEPVTLVCTAGLTNLALALERQPDCARGIREIVMAAGYYGLNRCEARAEWNILVDPEAAEIVFSAGIPIRAVGLDVSAELRDEMIPELLAQATGEKGHFLKKCDAYNRSVGLSPYSLMVDAMAIAAVVRPELFGYVRGTVVIHPEYSDERLMDFSPEKNGGVLAANELNCAGYLNLLKEVAKG